VIVEPIGIANGAEILPFGQYRQIQLINEFAFDVDGKISKRCRIWRL